MEISHKEKRRRLKVWHAECERVDALRQRVLRQARLLLDEGELEAPPVLPDYPAFPAECVDMRCGAKAKSTGEPCKSTQIFLNGRCLYHGGPSTGPKSAEGKLAALGNLKCGPEPHRMPDKS